MSPALDDVEEFGIGDVEVGMISALDHGLPPSTKKKMTRCLHQASRNQR